MKISERMLAGAAAAIALLVCVAGINSYLPGGGDNAAYIATAEGWLKEGRPAMLYLNGAPDDRLHPAGFSLLLAGVESIFGRNLPAMKLVLALFAAGFVCAAWRLIRERSLGSTAPVWVVIWVALCPILAALSHDILADVPSACFAVIAFGFAVRVARTEGSRWNLPLLLLSLSLSSVFRSAGLLAAAACLFYLCLEALANRKTPRFARIALAATAVLVVSVALAFWLERRETGYFSMLAAKGDAEATAGASDGHLERLERIISIYGLLVPNEILGYESFGPYYPIPIIGGGLCLLGLTTMLRRKAWQIPALWLGYQIALFGYLELRARTQQVAPAELRYYLPIFPLYACIVAAGIEALIDRCARSSRTLATVAFEVVVICPIVSIIAKFYSFSQPSDDPTTYVEWVIGAAVTAVLCVWCWRMANAGARWLQVAAIVILALAVLRSVDENVVRERLRGPAPEGQGWRDLYDAATWLKGKAQPAETVMSAKPSLVWFWSGQAGVPIPQSVEAKTVFPGESQEALMARADWIILDDLAEDHIAAEVLAPVIVKDGDHWQPRWRQGKTLVLRRVERK